MDSQRSRVGCLSLCVVKHAAGIDNHHAAYNKHAVALRPRCTLAACGRIANAYVSLRSLRPSTPTHKACSTQGVGWTPAQARIAHPAPAAAVVPPPACGARPCFQCFSGVDRDSWHCPRRQASERSLIGLRPCSLEPSVAKPPSAVLSPCSAGTHGSARASLRAGPAARLRRSPSRPPPAILRPAVLGGGGVGRAGRSLAAGAVPSDSVGQGAPPPGPPHGTGPVTAAPWKLLEPAAKPAARVGRSSEGQHQFLERKHYGRCLHPRTRR